MYFIRRYITNPIKMGNIAFYVIFSREKLIETKMYKIVFGLTLFWMLANVWSVEVRRDEKVLAIFLTYFNLMLFLFKLSVFFLILINQIKVAAKAFTRLVPTSSQRMQRENGSY